MSEAAGTVQPGELGDLDQMTCGGPFQPQLCCDSVKSIGRWIWSAPSVQILGKIWHHHIK